MDIRRKSRMPVIGIAAWRQNVEVWGSRMNIFQIDEAYVERIQHAGGIPVLLPHASAGMEMEVVANIDALMLTGGDDVDPALYGSEDEGSCRNIDIAADER